MKSFVDPQTGRLAPPQPDPAQVASLRRRTRWAIRIMLVFSLINIASLGFSLATLPKAFAEVRLASAVGLALSVVLVVLAVWTIRHEK
jgi:hypothetical protein